MKMMMMIMMIPRAEQNGDKKNKRLGKEKTTTGDKKNKQLETRKTI